VMENQHDTRCTPLQGHEDSFIKRQL